MICGFCKTRDVDNTHVRGCAWLKDAEPCTPAPPKLKEFSWDDVPEGRFAFEVVSSDPQEMESYQFFQTRRPTKGHWKGFLFIDELKGTGYSADYRKVPVKDREKKRLVATAILANPVEAAQLFGAVSKSCAKCGSPLDVAESLARGIGPVCWETVQHWNKAVNA